MSKFMLGDRLISGARATARENDRSTLPVAVLIQAIEQ
jgi:hypothetical protein